MRIRSKMSVLEDTDAEICRMPVKISYFLMWYPFRVKPNYIMNVSVANNSRMAPRYLFDIKIQFTGTVEGIDWVQGTFDPGIKTIDKVEEIKWKYQEPN